MRQTGSASSHSVRAICDDSPTLPTPAPHSSLLEPRRTWDREEKYRSTAGERFTGFDNSYRRGKQYGSAHWRPAASPFSQVLMDICLLVVHAPEMRRYPLHDSETGVDNQVSLNTLPSL